MIIDRQECYTLLFDMQSKGINIEEPLKKLVQSKDVHLDVIRFINNNRDLDITRFYNNLRKQNNTKKSRLYLQIMKEEEKEEELIKTASSFITHSFIFSESLEETTRRKFFKSIRLETLVDSIKKYITEYNIQPIKDILKIIKIDIKILENKEITDE